MNLNLRSLLFLLLFLFNLNVQCEDSPARELPSSITNALKSSEKLGQYLCSRYLSQNLDGIGSISEDWGLKHVSQLYPVLLTLQDPFEAEKILKDRNKFLDLLILLDNEISALDFEILKLKTLEQKLGNDLELGLNGIPTPTDRWIRERKDEDALSALIASMDDLSIAEGKNPYLIPPSKIDQYLNSEKETQQLRMRYMRLLAKLIKIRSQFVSERLEVKEFRGVLISRLGMSETPLDAKALTKLLDLYLEERAKSKELGIVDKPVIYAITGQNRNNLFHRIIRDQILANPGDEKHVLHRIEIFSYFYRFSTSKPLSESDQLKILEIVEQWPSTLSASGGVFQYPTATVMEKILDISRSKNQDLAQAALETILEIKKIPTENSEVVKKELVFWLEKSFQIPNESINMRRVSHYLSDQYPEDAFMILESKLRTPGLIPKNLQPILALSLVYAAKDIRSIVEWQFVLDAYLYSGLTHKDDEVASYAFTVFLLSLSQKSLEFDGFHGLVRQTFS